MDYLYFFNANMLCVQDISCDFLPNDDQSFSFLQHPGFYNKTNKDFTYERRKDSLALIKEGAGSHYFAGGLNGGRADDYLSLCKTLEKNIDKDLENKIIAIWHDESHLNHFSISSTKGVKVLTPIYGFPQDWELPFSPKIIIQDKSKFGGAAFLRDDLPSFLSCSVSYLKRLVTKALLMMKQFL
ncbi:MAG: hypothetical protein KAH18_03385 [Psychromonas sp.]|nr:hypothetical protein [Psychromonas sp.]